MNTRHPFPWGGYLRSAAIILLVTLSPIIGLLIVAFFAWVGDCEVNEAFVQPCVILGLEIGGFFAGLGVMGWFMLITLPLGAMALISWALVLGWHYFTWQRKN